MDNKALLIPEKYALSVLELAGLFENGLLCVLTYLFPFWHLDGHRIESLLFIVAWQVEGQMMSYCPCVRHC